MDRVTRFNNSPATKIRAAISPRNILHAANRGGLMHQLTGGQESRQPETSMPSTRQPITRTSTNKGKDEGRRATRDTSAPSAPVRQELHPRLDHPDGVREGVAGHAGHQAGREGVGRVALSHPQRSKEPFRPRVRVEVHRPRRDDAHERGPDPPEEPRDAVLLEDPPGDGARPPVRRSHLADGRRRGLQLRLHDLEGIRDARGDGAGGASREERA